MRRIVQIAIFAVSMWGPSVGYADTLVNGLFESYEIPNQNLSAFPQWLRVVEAIKKEQELYDLCGRDAAACPNPKMLQWRKFVNKLKHSDLTFYEKLTALQSFSYQWPYTEDIELYQQPDYWASPKEFLPQGGDCEDYAILKYVTLMDLGVRAEDLRIAVVKDTIRNMSHAVLAVQINSASQRPYILDSLMRGVLTDESFRHYTPVYSINETTRWIHIPKKELYSSE